ncbi:MAG TPA: HRDC domain-containing protein [Gemmatimonadales bacterium]|nr:HRDC domain-containing protein [Gemmatimonadales bacterium]
MVTGTAKRRVSYRYIGAPKDLGALVKRVSGEPLLAVDTEAASFHRFVDRIYLIQLSSRHETAIIDPLTVGDISELGALLADADIEVVFHDADYDLRILDRDYGVRARRLFDTRVAAQLLGEKAIGLAALLERYLGVKLDKKFQRADWSRRPLTAEMLDYAAMDTKHLPELRDHLRERLAAAGRLEWAEEEFARLENLRWSPLPANGDSYLRIKGARLLSRRALAVLRELAHWRDGVAADLDRASFRVMSNEVMLELAARPVRSIPELRAMRGISARLVDQRGEQLIAAIERGLAVSDKELPRFPRGERRATDRAFEQRVEKLKAARNAVASRVDLDPGVLCPKGTLEAVARVAPKEMAQLSQIPELRRWQIAVLGEDFLKALDS